MSSSRPKLIITKPQAQAAVWRSAIEATGWEVISMPLLVLAPRPETPQQRAVWHNLGQFSGVVVISPMAAQWCVQMFDTGWPQAESQGRWFGAGPGTAQAFAQNHLGLTMQFPKHGHRTEDLLMLQALKNIEQQKWLIVAGVGGRSTLFDALTQRGAHVTRLAVYERHTTTLNHDQLHQIKQLQSGQDIVQVSSQRALESLTSQLSAATTQSIDLLVSSPRLQQWAHQLGWQHVWLTTGASLDATLTALSHYRNLA